jgi:hypothetical protein
MCEERFAKSKVVHSIMRHVAETTGCSLDDLYTQVGWPLYKLYGHAHEAFRAMIPDAEAVFKRLADEVHGGVPPPVLADDVKEGILKNIRRASEQAASSIKQPAGSGPGAAGSEGEPRVMPTGPAPPKHSSRGFSSTQAGCFAAGSQRLVPSRPRVPIPAANCRRGPPPPPPLPPPPQAAHDPAADQGPC